MEDWWKNFCWERDNKLSQIEALCSLYKYGSSGGHCIIECEVDRWCIFEKWIWGFKEELNDLIDENLF